MSITRITGGELKNTSTSMNLSANDGNYQFNSPTTNQWQGNEDGIIEDNYEAPNKEDLLSNSINVRLNLFFDGTQNNKTNTEARSTNSKNHATYKKTGNKNDDSYENDYTNVARLFDAINPDAENQVAVYIEGIGTEDLKKDTKFPGVATGMGDTGTKAKVTKGCLDSAIQMKKKGFASKEIDYLYVNVYGFSRGAAAARHFLHVANKTAKYGRKKKIDDKNTKYHIFPDYFFNDTIHQFDITVENTSFIDKYGYFGACLVYQGMKIKKIIYNFVGIYDTVASDGFYHGNDVRDLKLNSVSKANYVYHIASEDEYRENFDLSNINSCGLSGLEIKLPGVHSDIGGSYLNNMKELSVLDNILAVDSVEDRKVAKMSREQRYNSFKKIVVDEGWYIATQLTNEFFYEKNFDPKTKGYENQYNYGLVGRRILFNTYDKIPLDLMINKSKEYNVKYDDSILLGYKINDAFINKIYNQLKQYVKACNDNRDSYFKKYDQKTLNAYKKELSLKYAEGLKAIQYSNYLDVTDLKKLRNEYLHWSVKSNLFGLSARKAGPLAQSKRKREIHNG
ncbi:DUF2235 domain-containing protein [Flavobacterium gelidilacus]|uniref:T6SS phospholipase effector Tle1-like catalytic domain-containing protein n=1 Tax=Flavobacterium gelidilacus TaxID=206041 RepID=UPI000414587F|nr:DUF2235 domain-containing protein [Flavobacterium gelidilacus]